MLLLLLTAVEGSGGRFFRPSSAVARTGHLQEALEHTLVQFFQLTITRRAGTFGVIILAYPESPEEPPVQGTLLISQHTCTTIHY